MPIILAQTAPTQKVSVQALEHQLSLPCAPTAAIQTPTKPYASAKEVRVVGEIFLKKLHASVQASLASPGILDLNANSHVPTVITKESPQ
jgi:hypothetical protein